MGAALSPRMPRTQNVSRGRSTKWITPAGYLATLLGVLVLWASLHVGSAPALAARPPAIHALATLAVFASGAALTVVGFRVLTASSKTNEPIKEDATP